MATNIYRHYIAIFKLLFFDRDIKRQNTGEGGNETKFVVVLLFMFGID